jgi:Protein of unknown function (DUF2846)
VGRLYPIVAAIGIVLQLAACAAGTSAIESQSRQKDGRLARLYFLRDKGLFIAGSTIAADVKVDGKPVGSVANGSYIFVDRSSGLHKLAVGTKLAMDFETEVRVDSGQDYYFSIGPVTLGVPGTDLLTHAVAGVRGEEMTGQPGMNRALVGLVFYRLDHAAGAAELAQLKAP